MPKGLMRGGSRRAGAKAAKVAALAARVAGVYRGAGMEDSHTLWNSIADRYGEAAQGLSARRRGARMDGGTKRKGIYKMRSPILKAAVDAAHEEAIEKGLFSRPRPKSARNAVGQAKPKGVKAFRVGNMRILVGRGKDGQTRINWGRVNKARKGMLALLRGNRLANRTMRNEKAPSNARAWDKERKRLAIAQSYAGRRVFRAVK